MNILITNYEINGRSGTELYVKELAIELKFRGHNIEIYTLLLGKLAEELIHQDINVVSNLNLLKNKPEIIHANHNILAYKVVSYFKFTPVVFFLHDRIWPYCYPFLHKNKIINRLIILPDSS
jgi:glycosyltransferase involved in cell wall biosynthesis